MPGLGSSDMTKYLEGEVLSPRKSIRAKCADCMGDYADGRESCENKNCPLFPYMPYNPNRVKRTNPGRKGMRPGERKDDVDDDESE